MGLLLRYGRVLLISIIVLWIGLAIGYQGFHRWGGASIAAVSLASLLIFLARFRWTEFSSQPFYQIHMLAAILHLISATGIGVDYRGQRQQLDLGADPRAEHVAAAERKPGRGLQLWLLHRAQQTS